MGLLAVWLGLAALIQSVVMVVYRPVFNDLMVTIDLYTCVFSYTFAGIILWGTRKQPAEFESARLQAKVAIGLSFPATAIVYALVALATPMASS
jgi:hypothetical protein